jgi:amino acid transporter
LARRLHVLDNAAVGFASISPVVGLYAVVLVGTVVAGPAWVWVLPVALAGQCLLLVVYSELAAEFPVARTSGRAGCGARRTDGSRGGSRCGPTR